MPLTPETTKNDKTPKKEKPTPKVSKSTYAANRYTDYMTPEEWVKFNTEKGYTESPLKSRTKYQAYYDPSKYTYIEKIEGSGGLDKAGWFKKGDEGKVVDYSKETDYRPEEIYGGPIGKPSVRVEARVWVCMPVSVNSVSMYARYL